MSETARELLAAYDALPPKEQREVAAAILQRSIATDELSGAGLDELAIELFRGYDAEEAGHADR